MERFLQLVGGLVLAMFATALGLLGWFCMSGIGQKTTSFINWLLTYGVMWLVYGAGIILFTVIQAAMLTAYTKPRITGTHALAAYGLLGVAISVPMPLLISSFGATATTVLAVALLVASLAVVVGYGWYNYEESRSALGPEERKGTEL